MCKDTHDGFVILINVLREIFPQVGQHVATTNRPKQFEKLYVDKSTARSYLASKLVIIKRLLCYCRDDFPPHDEDRIFLLKLSKCIDYDVKVST